MLAPEEEVSTHKVSHFDVLMLGFVPTPITPFGSFDKGSIPHIRGFS